MPELRELSGADIEIIERRETPDELGYLAPNSLRINGTEIAVPAGARINIHEITEDELVTVTLTVFARSVSIRPEPRA